MTVFIIAVLVLLVLVLVGGVFVVPQQQAYIIERLANSTVCDSPASTCGFRWWTVSP